MRLNRQLLIGFAALVLIAVIFAGGLLLSGTPVSASAAQDGTEGQEDEREGPDVPITGDALLHASAAALEYVGRGRVTETEVGDEEGYYEVEITLNDGRQVDVHLDENFNVLNQGVDVDESND